MKFNIWIRAFRLRTLPLALSTVFIGASLAHFYGYSNSSVFAFTLITTLFLQILSNLANDYGDSSHGVDNENRLGPKRTVQAGLISKRQMKLAIIFFVILSFISGFYLVFLSFGNQLWGKAGIMILIGILAIVSALKYTMGRNPYGYAGFGDLFVFVFFGLVGVVGTYFLFTHSIDYHLLLPASSIGLFSVGVLNINNMRDRENDKVNGKFSLVVKLGMENARIYHIFLLSAGQLLALIFMLLKFQSPLQFLFLLSLPLFILNLKAVFREAKPELLDPQLKKLAIATLLFSVLFGGSLMIV